jgi:hypothetical protein
MRRFTAATTLLLALGASATSARAQASLLGPGAAYVGGGMARVRTSGLDDRLEANGYPTFGQNAVTLGIGAYRTFANRMMFGIEASPFFVGEESHDANDVSLGGGHATLGFGYLFPLTPRMRVYPRVGVGAGGMAVEFDSDSDTIDFDDVLADPAPRPIEPDPVLARDGIVFDLGGGAEFLSRGDRGALVGVRIGYLVAPWDDDWELVYHGGASGGPDASISGFYARLVVGFAWGR